MSNAVYLTQPYNSTIYSGRPVTTPLIEPYPTYTWDPWEVGLVVFLGLVIIIIIIFFIWYFAFAHKGQSIGGSCNQNSDCSGGLYCGGNFKCQEGNSSGQGQGCQQDSQCEVGLVCQQGTCQNSFNPILQPLQSFNNAYLTTSIDNVTYYLNLDEIGNSFFSLTQSDQVFSYSSTQKLLTFGGQSVSVSNFGNLVVAGVKQPLVFTIDSANTIALQDQYGNFLNQAVNAAANNFNAFFFDQTHYPNSPIVSAITANFQIISATP